MGGALRPVRLPTWAPFWTTWWHLIWYIYLGVCVQQGLPTDIPYILHISREYIPLFLLRMFVFSFPYLQFSPGRHSLPIFANILIRTMLIRYKIID